MIEFASPAINPPWSSIGPGAIRGARAIYTIGSETAAAVDLFRTSSRQGIITALDVDFDEIDSEVSLNELLECTTVLFSNSETACRLAGAESPQEAAHRLCDRGPATVVVTRGRLGALAVDRTDGEAQVSGHEVAVLDSTGAGDCFAGAFLFGAVHGWSLTAKLELANIMAAMSTTAYGCQTAIPSLDQLLELPIARSMPIHALLSAQKEERGSVNR
jgi:sugar/nucleoside kinase (ribokinase family)